MISDGNSRGSAEPDRQLVDRADAISAEGDSLLKHDPTGQGLTILARECKGSNDGNTEPDRCHPSRSGNKVQQHELCVGIVVTLNRPTRVHGPATKGHWTGGVGHSATPLAIHCGPGEQQRHRPLPTNGLPERSNPRPSLPRGSSPSSARRAGGGLPKKRRPRGKPGHKEDADVGTAYCGIGAISTCAAQATR